VCSADNRSLLTNNVADFAVLARRWVAEGRQHHGLVFTSDASLPRTRQTIGRHIDIVDRLMSEHPGDDALIGHLLWLERP